MHELYCPCTISCESPPSTEDQLLYPVPGCGLCLVPAGRRGLGKPLPAPGGRGAGGHPVALADTPREWEISPGKHFAPWTLCFKGRSSLGEGRCTGIWVPSQQREQPSLALCQGELHYLLFLLSLPRCFFPAPTLTSFLLWIKSCLPLS